jgi:peptidoglycan/LPS O-acetylase OafA/YrhL
MNEFLKLFENLQTERVVAFLQSMQIGDLIHNPYFLGGVAAFAVISLLMKWRLLLALCLGMSGFVYLISYTMQKGTQLEGLSNPTLLVFVGGGAVIIGLVIYLLFIKSD